MTDTDNSLPVVEERFFEVFESTKRILDNGAEYWFARELASLLGYTDYRNFERALNEARLSMDANGTDSRHHFGDTNRMMALGKGASRNVRDTMMTRLAAYLTAMNGDPSKPAIAAAQHYFAVQTRKQEIAESRSPEEIRVDLRIRVSKNINKLEGVAKKVGVTHFDILHAAGYQGMYGGLNVGDIKERKGIDQREALLDRIGDVELAANDFRVTQARQRIEQEAIQGEQQAVEAHKEVGRVVREAMRQNNIVPEDLPAEPSIKRLVAKRKKELLPPSTKKLP